MKRMLIGALALLLSIASSATTLNPIQLLNPAGSSSGQAIVSTGASSAPAWGGVGLNGIAAIAANTVLANATASSASPTAFAMPSCSTSASALNWTTSTGFTCNTAVNATTLGGATFASPGAIGSTTADTGRFTTLQTTGAYTPSTTAGIVGTTLADNATAGSVGEFITSTATGVAATSATLANVTSITLTAGDWDVGCSYAAVPAGSTTTQGLNFGLTTTSAGQPVFPNLFFMSVSFAAGQGFQSSCPTIRQNVSTSTTIFLTAAPTFSVSTMTESGYLWARRRR